MTLTHLIIYATFGGWIWYTSVSRQTFHSPTISMTLRNIAWSASVFPFVWGMLIAHWFAPKQELPAALWGWGVGIPMMVVLITFDVYWAITGRERIWYRWPLWYFLLGMPVGFFFWPQRSIHAPF